ncbi:uncharacterized protein NPIL_303641 [Nephila pilipes]|uniref:DUF4503 domain-containing protein n=1 Tax=Nephila pilipes TaxID=299642 RepID=A0A8X6UIL5_NEPPI|nr:uncharacterized protein NPIL_303641 [Nephila pilipes]
MSNNITENLQCHIPFFNFKTKQHVSKSKLGQEFVKKGWNAFSSGFSQNNSLADNDQANSFLKGKKTVVTKPDRDPEILRKQILAEGYKSLKRKPVFELEEEFFSHKAKTLCTYALKKSFKHETIKKLQSHPLKKCTNSVFLEVQNIQSSFLQNGSKSLSKPDIKFFSDFNGDFNPETVQKKSGGQENVPKKSKPFQNPIIPAPDKFLLSMTVQKVQKTNLCCVQTLEMKNNSLLKPSMHDKIMNDAKLPIINSESREKNLVKSFKDLKFLLDAGNVVLDKKNCNTGQSLKCTLAGDEFSGSKGSNWVQSLVHADNEVTYEDPIGKKKIRNIISGGFAEQMMKLQRREKSEKVIWDHKIDRNKKKDAVNCLSLILVSVLWIRDFVIAKCAHSQSEVSDSHINLVPVSKGKAGFSCILNGPNNIMQEFQSKLVIVLFKRNIFSKLHLKIQSIFQLCPPWQTVFLPSMSCPAILCASFINFDPCSFDVNEYIHIEDKNVFLVPDLEQLALTSKNLVHRQHPFDTDEFFFKREESVSFSARIQRIWKLENRKLVSSESISNCLRYLLLLQTKDGKFHEILLFFYNSLPNVWNDFLSCCEGKCYKFSNLRIIQRLGSNSYQHLYKFLKLLTRHENEITECKLKQEFYYQLMLKSISNVPEVVREEGFPEYCEVTVEPLVTIFSETVIRRFTCIGKVLFQYKGVLYISDESLLSCNSHPKYIRFEFLFPPKAKTSFVGCSVFIKEALFLEGCLLLDNYSKFRLLPDNSGVDKELQLLNKIKLRQLAKVNLQSIISPISGNSEVSEFVTIKGEITDVDESSALTWLQCNLCLHENLVQDSNLIIYCLDCSQVVPKPILNVKMEVTLSCSCLPSIVVHIQLLSITIKRILQISDDNYQPQCNASDVLGKKVGPLFGCIRKCSTERNAQIFHVSEIVTN